MTAAARRKAVRDALAWVGLSDREAFAAGPIIRRAESTGSPSPGPSSRSPTSSWPTSPRPTWTRIIPIILHTMEDINRDLGTTFLFSTHDAKVIAHLRRKITLVDGRVTADEARTT